MKRLAFAMSSVLALTVASPLRAQNGAPDWTGGFGARLIPLVTHATPAVAGEDRTELYLTQPVLMVHAAALDGERGCSAGGLCGPFAAAEIGRG
ncbi:MAG: hypothetical protein KY464_12655, partial [Gemmatimonadetes bacterium]|nr:hypothetical protein [Gemmatimonadota bacterium]